jgi:HK97 family phage prohead protease
MERSELESDYETRVFPLGDIRFTEPGEDGAIGTISGVALRYGVKSDDLGGFREVIAPGAISNMGDDIAMLWSHDPSQILGRTSNRTLELTDDQTGLVFRNELPDTQAGRDAAVSIGRKDVKGMSFGFRTIRDEWETKGKDELRTLLEIRLLEVSPVAFPAYPRGTKVGVAKRSHDRWRERHGMPLSLARAIVDNARIERDLT